MTTDEDLIWFIIPLNSGKAECIRAFRVSLVSSDFVEINLLIK